MAAGSASNWIRITGLLLVFALAGGTTAGVPSEYDVKAAYLINILRFVQRKGGDPGGTYLTLGLHGAGAVEQSMAPLDGSAVHGKRLRIRAINVDSDLEGCDAVFFGGSTPRIGRMLARAAGARLLTVGNDLEFVPSGGMVALVLESRRIVVVVNQAALTSPTWSISSHLLEVARISGGGGQ